MSPGVKRGFYKKQFDNAILSTISLMGRVRAKYLLQYLHQIGLHHYKSASDLGKYLASRGPQVIRKEELRRGKGLEVYYLMKPRYEGAFIPRIEEAMTLLYGK